MSNGLFDRKTVSIDANPNMDLSKNGDTLFGSHRSKDLFAELFKDNFKTIYKQFLLLPLIDQQLYHLYYVQNFSQGHIKGILGVSQSAVGRRLSSIQDKLKFLLRMPSLNPVHVRRDLRRLLDDSLWETAFFYYWECNQNRVANMLETTPSGASYRLDRILRDLSKLAEAGDEEGSSELKFLALSYLDYFRFIKARANIINFIFKKAELIQRDPLQNTRNVFEP